MCPAPGLSLGTNGSAEGARAAVDVLCHPGALLPPPGWVPSGSSFSEPCLQRFLGSMTPLGNLFQHTSSPASYSCCGQAGGGQPGGTPCPWSLQIPESSALRWPSPMGPGSWQRAGDRREGPADPSQPAQDAPGPVSSTCKRGRLGPGYLGEERGAVSGAIGTLCPLRPLQRVRQDSSHPGAQTSAVKGDVAPLLPSGVAASLPVLSAPQASSALKHQRLTPALGTCSRRAPLPCPSPNCASARRSGAERVPSAGGAQAMAAGTLAPRGAPGLRQRRCQRGARADRSRGRSPPAPRLHRQGPGGERAAAVCSCWWRRWKDVIRDPEEHSPPQSRPLPREAPAVTGLFLPGGC